MVTLIYDFWNPGARSVRSIVNTCHMLMEDGDALSLAEMGDQPEAKRILGKTPGWDLFDGLAAKPGSRRTCLLLRTDRLEPVRDVQATLVMPKRKGVPGAAGYKLNDGFYGPKYVLHIEARDKDSNRTPIFGVKHVVPSHQFLRMRELAEGDFENTGDWVESTGGILLLNGDMNCDPDKSQIDPLRRAGLKCSHTVLGEVGTHGHRPIDQCWGRKVTFLSHEAVSQHKDHDTYRVRVKYPKAA